MLGRRRPCGGKSGTQDERAERKLQAIIKSASSTHLPFSSLSDNDVAIEVCMDGVVRDIIPGLKRGARIVDIAQQVIL